MSNFEKKLEIVFSTLEAADSIVIFGHKNPDGDCVGSVLGMKAALKTLFPQKHIYAVGTHPAYLPKVEESDNVSDDTIINSLALMVDLSDLDRVEDQRIRLTKNIVCIDHHVAQYELPFPVLRDEKAASATSIIARALIKRYGKIPSKKCATYLYMGLVTDSGRFQYDAEPDTLRIAAELIECGVEYKDMYQQLYRQSSLGLKYTAVIYQNFAFNGRVTYCCVTREMYTSLGLEQNDASGKVNLLANLDEHPIWAFFTEQEDSTIRVELRSNGHYDVQKVAVQFGGGGHIAASGCTLQSFDAVKNVLDALNLAEYI